MAAQIPGEESWTPLLMEQQQGPIIEEHGG